MEMRPVVEILSELKEEESAMHEMISALGESVDITHALHYLELAFVFARKHVMRGVT